MNVLFSLEIVNIVSFRSVQKFKFGLYKRHVSGILNRGLNFPSVQPTRMETASANADLSISVQNGFSPAPSCFFFRGGGGGGGGKCIRLSSGTDVCAICLQTLG